jgi:GAF domain-containing protein
MRRVEEPDELLFTVVRAVGEHLQVKRWLFIEVDIANDRGVIRHEYCQGLPSVAGEYKISDYSSVTMIDRAAGRTVINRDAQADPRTAAFYEASYQRYGEQAYMAVPLLREGRWVSALWVSTDSPREWRAEEVALLETVAERAWLTVENIWLNIATRRFIKGSRSFSSD